MSQRIVLVGLCSAVLLATTALTTLHREVTAPAAARVKQSSGPRFCASTYYTDREVDQIEQYAAAETKKLGKLPKQSPLTPIGTINVAFHVVYFEDAFGDTFGLLTESDVEAQIAALQAAFPNVTFDLVRDSLGAPTSITYTNNQDWFFNTLPGNSQELQMKTALHWNTSQFLNVYTVAGGFTRGSSPPYSDAPLGWATFPWELKKNPTNDGVVISYTTVPGGFAPYDEGDTLLHEVGHWCGLFHTFQGGCNSPIGDRVSDTPPEASPNFGCPASRDTCPAAGNDPINNFMDFSDDICLTNFTAGQETRMNQFLQVFRKSAIH